MEYKHKADIEQILIEDPLLSDKLFESLFAEVKGVYNKAEAFDAFYITLEDDMEAVAEIIKDYEAAGLDTDDYEFSQNIMISIKNNLDKLIESGDSE